VVARPPLIEGLDGDVDLDLAGRPDEALEGERFAALSGDRLEGLAALAARDGDTEGGGADLEDRGVAVRLVALLAQARESLQGIYTGIRRLADNTEQALQKLDEARKGPSDGAPSGLVPTAKRIRP